MAAAGAPKREGLACSAGAGVEPNPPVVLVLPKPVFVVFPKPVVVLLPNPPVVVLFPKPEPNLMPGVSGFTPPPNGF